MSHEEALLVVVSVAGFIAGAFVAWWTTWHRAYQRGLVDAREVWTRAMDEAHASMLQNIKAEREQTAAALSAATKAGKR